MSAKILFLLFLLPFRLHSQSDETIVHQNFDTYEDLKGLVDEHEIEELLYIDSLWGFKVKVPDWLTLLDGGEFVWGGVMPPVNGIQNAIVIKVFDKGESFEEFRERIVEGMIFGEAVSWSSEHIAMGKKKLDEYQELGVSYKVYISHRGLIYHSQYILVNASETYLWIDFTSTGETFDLNKSRFDEFMEGFELIR